jgi:hypothetical protein
MSCFEVEENDFDLALIKYNNYYLKELTYYGSSKTEQMMMLLGLGQELNIIEKNIIENHYNYYVEMIMNDITDPSIYYVQKILFIFTNIISKMFVLFITNEINTEECHYKSRYLIGCIENYINKIIEPIESNLEHIIKSNNIFKLDYSFLYLKRFIEMNKKKFTSRNVFEKINKVLKLFEKK